MRNIRVANWGGGSVSKLQNGFPHHYINPSKGVTG
jgi:hypothetical protein